MISAHVAALTSSGEAGVAIGLGIPFCICAAAAIIVWSYFRLQRRRADAVAMAHYRKRAEEAVTNHVGGGGVRPAHAGVAARPAAPGWSPARR